MAQSGTPWPEAGNVGATGANSNSGSDKGNLSKFLEQLTLNVNKILGNGANTQDISGTLGTYATSFRLNSGNPLAELSAIGHRIIDLALEAAKKANACNAAKAAARANEDPSDARFFRSGVEVSCNTDTTASFLISMITAAMMTAGITLAFMLPLLPFIRFMFGLLTWILALIEAVVAIPLIALAHIRTDGEGLSGPMARTAYLLVLQIFVRPILMIFGLIVALLVFNLMIVALNELFMSAARGAEGGGDVQGMSLAVYTLIYAFMAYAFANASFKAIDLIPNQALQWIGGQNVGGVDESHRISQGVSQVGGVISSLPNRQQQYLANAQNGNGQGVAAAQTNPAGTRTP
jgi:conjugal transfer/type IV secretion protein DotA/TraY